MGKTVGDSVWLVYRVMTFHAGRKVEGIFRTHTEARKFAAKLGKELDPAFGIDIQMWTLDKEEIG